MNSLLNVCFMCLNTPEYLIDYKPENDTVHYVQYVLPELFIFGSQLPRRMCSDCYASLQSFYKFKKMCLENNTRLKCSIQNIHVLKDVRKEKVEDIDHKSAFDKKKFNCQDFEIITDNNVLTVQPTSDVIQAFPMSKYDVDKFNCQELNKKEEGLEATQNYNPDISSDSKLNKIDETVCLLCNKKLKNKQLLKKHLMIHTGIKNLECSVCNKYFRRNADLQAHQKTHVYNKDFECTVCEKKFILPFRLNEHMKLHTNAKVFECSVCGKKILFIYNLNKHMLLHGEKKFQCAICNRCFSRKDYLVKHIKTHNNKGTVR